MLKLSLQTDNPFDNPPPPGTPKESNPFYQIQSEKFLKDEPQTSPNEQMYYEDEKNTAPYKNDPNSRIEAQQHNALNQAQKPESEKSVPSFPANIPEQVLESDHFRFDEIGMESQDPARADVLTFTDSDLRPVDRMELDSEIGMITELIGPENGFSGRPSGDLEMLSPTEIKNEFLKNNYQSNFSMGPGYDDVTEVEKNYEEVALDMGSPRMGLGEDDLEMEERFFLKKERGELAGGSGQ